MSTIYITAEARCTIILQWFTARFLYLPDSPDSDFLQLPGMVSMYTILTIVLATVGCGHALSTPPPVWSCSCPPNMTAVGYDALQASHFHFYYNGQTGDNLIKSTEGDRVILDESSTGILYQREGDVCFFVAPRWNTFRPTYCLDNFNYTAVKEELDGHSYYEWEFMDDRTHKTLVVDASCSPKILHERRIDDDMQIFSYIFFNIVHHADVSHIYSFNKTGCFEWLP